MPFGKPCVKELLRVLSRSLPIVRADKLLDDLDVQNGETHFFNLLKFLTLVLGSRHSLTRGMDRLNTAWRNVGLLMPTLVPGHFSALGPLPRVTHKTACNFSVPFRSSCKVSRWSGVHKTTALNTPLASVKLFAIWSYSTTGAPQSSLRRHHGLTGIWRRAMVVHPSLPLALVLGPATGGIIWTPLPFPLPLSLPLGLVVATGALAGVRGDCTTTDLLQLQLFAFGRLLRLLWHVGRPQDGSQVEAISSKHLPHQLLQQLAKHVFQHRLHYSHKSSGHGGSVSVVCICLFTTKTLSFAWTMGCWIRFARL